MKIDYRSELDPEQYQAVTAVEGPVLIIAGAGSGKTRVITYRIAYMLDKDIPQSSILALTFTNKAAREMEERVKALTKRRLQNLAVSTFHAFGVRILRKEIHRLGWKDSFSIYDETDRIQLIRDCAREAGLRVEGFDATAAGAAFSEARMGRKALDPGDSYWKVYEEYQAALKAHNAVDFDDLILKPIEVFETFPEALGKYRDQYRYIMIDEFQDTSRIQYRMMRLLADDNVFVVGDDDQSIYSWRGADYGNIQQFEKDWPGLKEVKLERNYRSTSTILDAANAVIANNENRKEKALWSPSSEGGAPIEVYYPADEEGEARFIARTAKQVRLAAGIPYSGIGILIRTNSLTRHLEEALLAENVPYKVSGGTSFFQRREIKDILSYLRVIANPQDDVNLIRILNVPRRGLGRKALESLQEYARRMSSSLHAALESLALDGDSGLADRARADALEFLQAIRTFREEMLGRRGDGPRGLAGKIRKMVDAIDYWGYILSENPHSEKAAKWKSLNVESLIRSIDTWEKDPDNMDPSIYAWLNRISLITRDDLDDQEDAGKVNLMTVHASKGLEFEVVFIAGCEDGIMPHARAVAEGAGSMEEERRLFYVAVTRARRKLYATACRQRRRQSQTVDCVPSPFLAEIPGHLITHYEEPEITEDEADAVFAGLRKMWGE
ncbi:MAG TPA: UvrD-helicase domain-containing protein [Magnetospirillaceae bacterium]|nr:UvrD-helicase domain-containing protein [Magnetospirillaceae bacterium]